MRKWILLASLMAATFSMASLNANRAVALTIGNPACLSVAAGEANLIQDVAYVCRRVRRCGPYGHCAWRRSCWWTEPGWGYYDYGYRGYGYGDWNWRHRYWRHRDWHY